MSVSVCSFSFWFFFPTEISFSLLPAFSHFLQIVRCFILFISFFLVELNDFGVKWLDGSCFSVFLSQLPMPKEMAEWRKWREKKRILSASINPISDVIPRKTLNWFSQSCFFFFFFLCSHHRFCCCYFICLYCSLFHSVTWTFVISLTDSLSRPLAKNFRVFVFHFLYWATQHVWYLFDSARCFSANTRTNVDAPQYNLHNDICRIQSRLDICKWNNLLFDWCILIST